MNGLASRLVPYTYSIRLLFGRFFFQFGLCFVVAGLLFVREFVSVTDFQCAWLLSRGFATTRGFVSGCKETPYTENRKTIVEVNFRYKVEGSRELSEVSYSPGICPDTGTEVEVEYLPENPSIARISGMRCHPFPLGAGLGALLFLFVGGIFALASLRNGIRTLHLVRAGLLGNAQVVSMEATHMKVHRRTVYRIKLRFLSQDGQGHDAVTKTHRVQGISKGATVDLLFDPSNPSHVVLLSDLPGPITGLETGQLTFSGSFIRAIPVLLLPVATLFVLYLFFVPR
jgi:hypothetical protein